jgi:hypothetical protein
MFIHYIAEYADINSSYSIFPWAFVWNAGTLGHLKCNECIWIVPGTVND